MTLTSNEYISTACNGNAGQCDATRASLADYLKPLYERQQIRGYSLRTVRDRTSLLEEKIGDEGEAEHIMLHASRHHKEPFPFVLINITFDEECLPKKEQERIQERFKLDRTKEGPWKR